MPWSRRAAAEIADPIASWAERRRYDWYSLATAVATRAARSGRTSRAVISTRFDVASPVTDSRPTSSGTLSVRCSLRRTASATGTLVMSWAFVVTSRCTFAAEVMASGLSTALT